MQLDRITMEELIAGLKSGEGAAKEKLIKLAGSYPNDTELQEAMGLLEEGKDQEALAVLENAVSSRMSGYKAGGLPFDDRRDGEKVGDVGNR